jgi:hypothetical protein
MARYYDTEADLRFVALDLSEQLRPGTFEHALNYLIDHELDLGSGFLLRSTSPIHGVVPSALRVSFAVQHRSRRCCLSLLAYLSDMSCRSLRGSLHLALLATLIQRFL